LGYTFDEINVSSVEEIINRMRVIQSSDGNSRVPLMRGESRASYSPTAGIFRKNINKGAEKIFSGSFLEMFQLIQL